MSMMKTLLVPTLLLALVSVVQAENAHTAAAPKKAHPASSHEQLKGEAKGLALGNEAAEAVSDNQLAIASRVLTGRASCEFDQSVSVEPLNGQPGTFKVAFKNANYTMVPEETTSGAVRLQDKKAGVVWLQIPTKSMLMNSKVGQRLVDNCTQAEQRVAAGQ